MRCESCIGLKDRIKYLMPMPLSSIDKSTECVSYNKNNYTHYKTNILRKLSDHKLGICTLHVKYLYNMRIPLSMKCGYITPLSRKVTNFLDSFNLIKNDKGDTNMGNVSALENQLMGRLGIRGMISDAEETAVRFVGRKFKSKFGIEMNITNSAEIRIVTKWIKKYDKNFNNHIQNPYVLDEKINEPILCGAFIIHISKATYIYINASIRMYNRSKDNNNEIYYNPLYIYIFGKKCFAVFKSLSKYIKNNFKSDEVLYSITGKKDNGRSMWTCTASTLTPRTMDTIFIDEKQKERIIRHLDKWCTDEDTYINRGLLYKTGILLHGCPGCGKSSMAMAIANYLGCSLVTIDTTTFQYMDIPAIVDSMVADERRYVVLIDEIDFKSREDENITDVQEDKISKLLQFLDSPQSPTNVVFVATTNHYNKLDPALIRPGRFDLIEEMGDISVDIARDMCKSFDVNDSDIDTIIKSFENNSNGINPSSLQNAILNFIKTSDVNGQESVKDLNNKE